MAREIDEVKEFDSQERKMLKDLDEKLDRATNLAVRDMLRYLDKEMREIYRSVIVDFYADYYPAHYEREYSLYSILYTRMDYGNTPGMRYGFEPIYMTPFRSGYRGEDGLYDQVFRHGWHGGADSGYGHPAHGTPYWRTPYPSFNRWGDPAEVADISPLEDFNKRIDESIDRFSDEFGRLIDKYCNQIIRG